MERDFILRYFIINNEQQQSENRVVCQFYAMFLHCKLGEPFPNSSLIFILITLSPPPFPLHLAGGKKDVGKK